MGVQNAAYSDLQQLGQQRELGELVELHVVLNERSHPATQGVLKGTQGYSRALNDTRQHSRPPATLTCAPAADIEEITQPVPVDGRFTANAATTQVRRAAAPPP